MDLAEQSAKEYGAGQFQRSIDLLKEAYALEPSSVLFYNLGRAYEGLGDTPSAIKAYRDYLSADPKAPDRAAVEQRIATLEKLTREKEELERQRQRDAALRRASSGPTAPGSESRPSAVPWVIVGIGAVGVGAGAILGEVAVARHDEAAAESLAAESERKNAAAKDLATAANVALISGAVLGAVGIVWGVIDVASSRRASSGGDRGTASRRRPLLSGFAGGAF